MPSSDKWEDLAILGSCAVVPSQPKAAEARGACQLFGLT